MIKLHRTCNVPISSILHVDRPVYRKEGYAGKNVFSWPIYKFFIMYHSGEKERARQLFACWYSEQYNRYSKYSKSRGGMKNGTLEQLYHNLQSKDGDITFEYAVEMRVKQRFSLFENIRTRGYVPDKEDPVQVIKIDNERFTLFGGGHHRVAIMAAIGYHELPGVYVFLNKPSYFLNKYLKRGKTLLSINSPLEKTSPAIQK